MNETLRREDEAKVSRRRSGYVPRPTSRCTVPDAVNVSRRNSLLVLGPLVARSRRGAPDESGLAVQPGSDARPRSPGRLEVTLQAVPLADPRADRGGPRPLRRDHAEPRRQARRLGARDPDPGRTTRSSSSCPASRIPQAAAEIIGTTAQLGSSSTSRTRSRGRRSPIRGSRSRPRRCTGFSPRCRRRSRDESRRTTSSTRGPSASSRAVSDSARKRPAAQPGRAADQLAGSSRCPTAWQS